MSGRRLVQERENGREKNKESEEAKEKKENEKKGKKKKEEKKQKEGVENQLILGEMYKCRGTTELTAMMTSSARV